MNKIKSDRNKRWWIYGLLISAIVLIVILCILCFDAIGHMHGDFKEFLNYSKPLADPAAGGGALKDAPSCVVMVYVGVITALITFIAFLVPLLFNFLQHTRHSENREDIAQERFENKFFFYVEAYTNIVNNIEITNLCRGHNSFNYIFYELQALFFIIKDMKVRSRAGEALTSGEIANLSVSIALNGFTPNSRGDRFDIIYSKYTELLEPEEYMRIVEEVSSYKEMDAARLEELHKTRRFTLFNNYARFRTEENRTIYWFRGKRSDLVPYFKLIKTAFDFIEKHFTEHDIDEEDKKYYINLLNAQMSDHELGLLYSFVHSKENYIGIDREYVRFMVDEARLPELYNFNYWTELDPDNNI